MRSKLEENKTKHQQQNVLGIWVRPSQSPQEVDEMTIKRNLFTEHGNISCTVSKSIGTKRMRWE